jgi:RimJ/RimL family protein N-acetyltransferase
MDVSSLLSLRLRTPRLLLRLPAGEELVELARVAERGIHPPEEMPFAVAWTDDLTVDGFVAFHEAARERWRPEDWSLLFGVWAEGRLAGSQEVAAEGFAARRTVVTGSWLGQEFQRRGYGTEMRAAVLELAFAGLGAEVAFSGALEDSVASARVSEKLGYEPAGEEFHSPRGEPVREQRFRLDRARWEAVERPPVEIEGLEPCLPLFGL